MTHIRRKLPCQLQHEISYGWLVLRPKQHKIRVTVGGHLLLDRRSSSTNTTYLSDLVKVCMGNQVCVPPSTADIRAFVDSRELPSLLSQWLYESGTKMPHLEYDFEVFKHNLPRSFS